MVAEFAPRACCLIAAAGADPVHPLDQILEAYERCREPKRLHLLRQRGLDLRYDPGWKCCMQLATGWFANTSRRADLLLTGIWPRPGDGRTVRSRGTL